MSGLREHQLQHPHEPLCAIPRDACLCFMRTEMDVLAINSFVLKKQDQIDLS